MKWGIWVVIQPIHENTRSGVCLDPDSHLKEDWHRFTSCGFPDSSGPPRLLDDLSIAKKHCKILNNLYDNAFFTPKEYVEKRKPFIWSKEK